MTYNTSGGDKVNKILMQAAIDAAWLSEDVEARRLQRELFPRGKPSVEEFVAKIALFVASGGMLDVEPPQK